MELLVAASRANKFVLFDSTGAVGVESLSSGTGPTVIGRQQFTGDGTTTVFTLAATSSSAAAIIYIDGVYQEQETYTVVGTTLTFTEAPPTNASIEVLAYKITDVGTTDANAVTYTPAGTGAVQTTVQTKLRESVSVKDFGAVGDGVTDDTAAFQNAATAVAARVTITSIINRSAIGIVTVPDGNYLLTSNIDTNGKDIVFELSPSSKITGIDYIYDRILIKGIRTSVETYGTEDYACGFSVMANGSKATNARVLSLTGPEKLSTYTSRDSVATYSENTLDSALHSIPDSGTTYTPTTVSFSSPIDTSKLRVGMIIDTKHATPYSGFIESFTTTSVTVSAWYPTDGSEIAGTPSNGTGCYINPIKKIWAANFNFFVTENGLPSTASGIREATGLEIGLIDSSTTGSQPLTVGVDVPNIGSRDGKFAFWGRGTSSAGTYGWESTYVSWRHKYAGFKAQYGMSGSNNYHSIGQGESSAGAFTNAGYYDYKSTTSFMAQPSTGGDAYLCRAPDGAINRYQVTDKGRVNIRTTDASRAYSIRSQNDATEYFGINASGQVGPFAASLVTVTSTPYTAVGGNHVIICSSGAGTVNLVNAVTFPGRILEVVNRSGGSVTVSAVGGQNIDGSTTSTVLNNESGRFISTGSNWVKA